MKRTLDSSSRIMEISMERLTTGLRINSAADDPAELAISKKLERTISGVDAANNNISMGTNKLTVFDNHMESMTDLFNSVRELAVSASSGTYSAAALQSFHDQAQDILSNAEDIANEANAELGAAAVLLTDVAFSEVSMDVQTGANFDMNDEFTLDKLGVGFHLFDGIDLTTQAGAQAALTEIDEMLDYLSAKRSYTGTQINVMDTFYNNNADGNVKLSENLSYIRDADIAAETAELTKQQILQETTMMMIAQLGEMQSNLVMNLL